MPEIERTQITIVDLENLADTLSSVLTLVQARDLEVAALRMSPPVPSALSLEAQRSLERVEGLIKDFYYEREVASRSGRTDPESEEPLPDRPLGRPVVTRPRDPWDFPAQQDAVAKDEMFRRGSAAMEIDDDR